MLALRIIVHKQDGSEKYSLVRSATETVAEIDRVLAARHRAICEEVREITNQPTKMPDRPEHLAHNVLINRRRACRAPGPHGRSYFVFGHGLAKRSKYYAFRAWADTPEAAEFLWKRKRARGGQEWWSQISLESEEGRFVLHRRATTTPPPTSPNTCLRSTTPTTTT